jgi:hypothetical protein
MSKKVLNLREVSGFLIREAISILKSDDLYYFRYDLLCIVECSLQISRDFTSWFVKVSSQDYDWGRVLCGESILRYFSYCTRLSCNSIVLIDRLNFFPEFGCLFLHHGFFSTRYLLRKGVDINSLNKKYYGYQTPFCAFSRFADDTVRLMIRSGADGSIRSKGRYGGDCLLRIQKHTPAYHVELLIEAGGDPDGLSNDGTSALIHVLNVGNPEAAEVLIRHDIDVNYCMINGTSAILVAVEKNYLDVVKMMLEAGALKNIKYDRQKSLMEREMSSEMRELLKSFRQSDDFIPKTFFCRIKRKLWPWEDKNDYSEYHSEYSEESEDD